jgi:cytochrome c biogenesis protein CcmG, thiol:disulfide interchange protein DsbE
VSTRTPAKKPAAATPSTAKPDRNLRTGLVVGALVAVIVIVAAVIAIVSSGGDDSDTSSGGSSPGPAATTPASDGSVAPTTGAPTGAEFAPVQVDGAPLAPYEGGSDTALGSVAPTVSGVSFDGSPVTIAPGRPTLVVFLAHWCPHCQAEVPRLVEWNAEGGRPEGVDVIGVATGTDDRRDNYPPSEWLAGEGWPFPVLLDDQEYTGAIAMGVSAFPFFVLLDENGTVVWRDSGELSMDDLTTVITATLGA